MKQVSTENMVLHLPFDEDAGSTRAYNYAPNRTAANDGIVSGNSIFDEEGGYLAMDADAACAVPSNIISFGGEFTITGYIRTNKPEIRFLMNYAGIDQYQEHTEAVKPGDWYFVAIQRVFIGQDYYTRFMVDDSIVYNEVALGTPVGCCIIDNATVDHSIALDDVKTWNRALTLSEIMSLMRTDEDVEYYVSGTNFKTFGVEVSKADGLLDALERKEPLRVDWNNYHGEVVHLSRPRWSRREISLECFIVASDNRAFVHAVNKFMAEFNKAGLVRLTCEYQGSIKPLEFDVYRDEKVEVDKTWNDELMVGTFTLALIEPSPIKRVLRFTCQGAADAQFTLSTDKMIQVSWGDGDDTCEVSTNRGSTYTSKPKSSNIHGESVVVRHHYSAAGSYNIVIHGVIEDITNFSTNCIVVWNKL